MNFNGTAVATGCSLGVDSLSAVYGHLENNVVEGFKLTHLTLFNSGQLGDYDLEASEQNFYNNVEDITPLANILNLPVLAINSNLNSFYKSSGIFVLQTVAVRTMAFALSVQKLIRYYIFGSTYPVNKIKFDDFDTECQEAALLPLLSTENFQPILADPFSTRVDKTRYVISKPLTSKYLKVCWAEQTAYEIWHNTMFLDGKTKANCGWCDKCLRTLLTIEVINNGNIEDYKDRFDIDKYYQYRDKYIAKIFAEKDKNVFYQEIVNLIIQEEYPIPNYILKKYHRDLLIQRFKNKLFSLFFKIKKKINSVVCKSDAVNKTL